MNVPATVQRMIVPEVGMPFIEHRTRDVALFADSEWGWSRDGREAYVFPTREKSEVPGPDEFAQSAEFHVEALKAQGVEHVWSCVFGAAARAEREIRQADRAAKLDGVELEAEAERLREPVGERPVRRASTITERIQKARMGNRRRRARRHLSPSEVYERDEKRGLA